MWIFFAAVAVKSINNSLYLSFKRTPINFTNYVSQVSEFYVSFCHFEDQYNAICIEAQGKNLTVTETEFIRSHNHSIRNSNSLLLGNTIVTKSCCYSAIGGGPNNWEYGVFSYNEVKSVYEELNSCTLSRGHQVATEGHLSRQITISAINISFNYLHRTSGYYIATHSDDIAIVKFANLYAGCSSWDTIRTFNASAQLSYHNVMNCSCIDGPYSSESFGIIYCTYKALILSNSVLQQCRGNYTKIVNCTWKVDGCLSDNDFEGISSTGDIYQTLGISYYQNNVCYKQAELCTDFEDRKNRKKKVFPIYLFVGISKEYVV